MLPNINTQEGDEPWRRRRGDEGREKAEGEKRGNKSHVYLYSTIKNNSSCTKVLSSQGVSIDSKINKNIRIRDKTKREGINITEKHIKHDRYKQFNNKM